MNPKRLLYGGNNTFYSMFDIPMLSISFEKFVNGISFTDSSQRERFSSFTAENSGDACQFELYLNNGRTLEISKKLLRNNHQLLSFTDITAIAKKRIELTNQNSELMTVKQTLNSLAENARELSIARTKAQAAQNMHDILGHSLTVVIGTTDLAAAETGRDAAVQKLSQVSELLISSLNDLKNSLTGKEFILGQTSLIKAIKHLKNDNLSIDFTYQGNVYELNCAQTEAIYRLCQEAVTNAIKHGKAKTLHLILRYKPDEIEVFAIDNGLGCNDLVKSYGLSGIEARINKLFGNVDFGSDGENGFVIHAVLPKII